MRTVSLLLVLILLVACAPPVLTVSSPAPAAETQPAKEHPAVSEDLASNPEETDPTSTPLPAPEVRTTSGQDPFLLAASWSPGRKQHEIFPVNPASGGLMEGYEPLVLGKNGYLYTFSQDGKRLAIVDFHGQSCDSYAGGSRCRGGHGELLLVELPAWEILRTKLPFEGTVETMAFNQQADQIALATSDRDGQELFLLDGENGGLLARRSLDFPVELLAFNAMGSSLVVYGTPINPPAGMAKPEVPRALLIDSESFETLWEQTLPQITSGHWCLQNCEDSHELIVFASWRPGIVLSPGGDRLFIVHADEDRLTTLDFASREVRSTSIQEKKSWIERLLALTAGTAQAKAGMEGAFKIATLSPDGSTLYTAGFAMHTRPDEEHGWLFEEEALPLQAIDAASGLILATQPTKLQGIHGLRFMPDGSELLVDRWSGNQMWTSILEATSLEPVKEIRGWDLHPVEGPDGDLTWLGSRPSGSRTRLAILDPETWKPAYELKENGSWLTP